MLCLARGKLHEAALLQLFALLATGEVVSVCNQQTDSRDLDDKAFSQTAFLLSGPMLTQE